LQTLHCSPYYLQLYDEVIPPIDRPRVNTNGDSGDAKANVAPSKALAAWAAAGAAAGAVQTGTGTPPVSSDNTIGQNRDVNPRSSYSEFVEDSIQNSDSGGQPPPTHNRYPGDHVFRGQVDMSSMLQDDAYNTGNDGSGSKPFTWQQEMGFGGIQIDAGAGLGYGSGNCGNGDNHGGISGGITSDCATLTSAKDTTNIFSARADDTEVRASIVVDSLFNATTSASLPAAPPGGHNSSFYGDPLTPMPRPTSRQHAATAVLHALDRNNQTPHSRLHQEFERQHQEHRQQQQRQQQQRQGLHRPVQEQVEEYQQHVDHIQQLQVCVNTLHQQEVNERTS